MTSDGKRPAAPKGKAAGEAGAAPGRKSSNSPGRVLRAEDWVPTPARGMSAFSYTSLRAPGRPGGENPEEANKQAALIARLRQSEEHALQALAAERKAREEGEKAALARGRDEGRREGEASARARFDAQVAELRSEVEGVLSGLGREKREAFLALESEAAGLLAFALRRVYGEIARGLPEAVLPLIQEAVRSLGHASGLVVKVHPDDLSVAAGQRSFWQHLEIDGDVRCVADARVPKGGCVVVADSTTARMDPDALGRKLAEAVESACADRRRALEAMPESPEEPENPSAAPPEPGFGEGEDGAGSAP